MILPPAGESLETAPVRPAAAAPPSQATPSPQTSTAAPTVDIEAPAQVAPPTALAAEDRAEDVPTETRACTAAQLRRFIKSRPYVPMHELRRRFELNGLSDDVTPIPTPSGMVYVGLLQREATFIADLVTQGDVGLELCRDPFVPMVVGVYAMRPISRQ